jgi:hypothetical protein
MSKNTAQAQQAEDVTSATTTKLRVPLPPAIEGFDPYSNSPPATPSDKPRRTLDDMRKLSEEIKKNRQRS